MHNLFILSRDKALCTLLIRELKMTPYKGYVLASTEELIRYVQGGKADVIVLDCDTTKEDILEYIKRFREIDQRLGLITIGTELDIEFIEKSYLFGGDRCIDKTLPECLIRAKLRRTCERVMQIEIEHRQHLLVSGDILLDTKRRALYKKGVEIKLTTIEYELLKYFLMNQQIAVSRNQILDWVWGTTYIGDPKVIDVNIKRLREKIEDDSKRPKYISTVWGFGYKWVGTKEY